MSGWDGVPLQPYFIELTDAPVILDNDVNVIALAERRGDRHAIDDMLVIKASTGLGAGIIAGGSLQRGAVQAAGEFGHNKTAAARLACRCGDTGCLEAIAGGWALVNALATGPPGRSYPRRRGVGHSGDAEARRMIRASGRYVGEVLAGAVNLLNPALLVVAGDMARAYDIFVAGLRERCTATRPRSRPVRSKSYRPPTVTSLASSVAPPWSSIKVLSPRLIDEALGADAGMRKFKRGSTAG